MAIEGSLEMIPEWILVTLEEGILAGRLRRFKLQFPEKNA